MMKKVLSLSLVALMLLSLFVATAAVKTSANGAAPTTLTATTNGNHNIDVTKNGKFTITGTLSTDTGALAGKPVYLEALYEGSWQRISLDKVTGNQGQYSFKGYITVVGTYSIRAHFAGTSAYGASVSDTITVIVKTSLMTATFQGWTYDSYYSMWHANWMIIAGEYPPKQHCIV